MTSRRSVVIGLVVALAETVALGLAATITDSVALRTQTITALADVAVGLCLLLGVVRSDRLPDDRHPLGYGRERFFWSFIAAAGIFVGGVGAAAAETFQALVHPPETGSYVVGIAVLAVVVVLEVIALLAGLRPLTARSAERGLSLPVFLWQGTDPAVTTVFLSSAAGLGGGVVAIVGLLARAITGQTWVDPLASGLIGLLLLVTSLLLLHTSRELLTGRGVPQAQVAGLRRIVLDRPEITEVPDIFAIVVGPACLLVEGDVVLEDSVGVPRMEAAIAAAAADLRSAYPAVTYVYLNPVAARRGRRRS